MSNTNPPVYAIFSGGGVKGAAFVGAVKQARKYVQFKAVGGTSAGAIVATLLALGCNDDELEKALFEAPYMEFFKRRWFRFVWDPTQGLFTPDPLLGWLRKQIHEGVRRKLPGLKHQSVTFEDLNHIPGALPLKIVATNVTSRNVEVFSHRTHPKIEIAYAVLASCSFPVLFPAVKQFSHQLVDGGVISNFPMWLFNEERQEAKSQPTPVLGFALTTQSSEADDPSVSAKPPNQLYSLFQSILTAQDRVQERYLDVARLANVIRIPVAASTFDVTQGNEERTTLFDAGYRAASEYFDKVPPLLHQRVPAKAQDYVAEARRCLDAGDAAGAISRIAREHLLRGGVAVDNGWSTNRRFVKYYIDLMAAATDRDKLVVLAEALKLHIEDLKYNPKRIVGIKKGNMLLAAETAWIMNTPLVLAKADLSYKIGAPFDGSIEPDDSVFIVDDIASDSSILISTIEHVRIQGALVLGVVVLLERSEGDARNKIEALGVRLHSVCTIGDGDIDELIEKERGFARSSRK